METESTLARTRAGLATAPVDALLVTSPAAMRWLTGFSGSNGAAWIDASSAVLVTDPRYASQAAAQAPDFRITIDRDLVEGLAASVPAGNVVGYDPATVTAEFRDHAVSRFDAELVPITGVLEPLMAVKTPEEIAHIEHAQQVTDTVFSEILSLLRPGVSEIEIAAELAYRQLRHGAEGLPAGFWPIVASGPNSSLPHATASDRRIERGDVVLLDFGCTVHGYASDMSRTVSIGQAGEDVRTAYELVLQAQTAALAQAKAGMTGKALDAVGRGVIEAGGHEMPHSLGHGVGLDIHEWPILGKRGTEPLPAGAVVTIEPGVYVEGRYGIRIEDMVLLEASGCRNLTASPKGLIEL